MSAQAVTIIGIVSLLAVIVLMAVIKAVDEQKRRARSAYWRYQMQLLAEWEREKVDEGQGNEKQTVSGGGDSGPVREEAEDPQTEGVQL